MAAKISASPESEAIRSSKRCRSGGPVEATAGRVPIAARPARPAMALRLETSAEEGAGREAMPAAAVSASSGSIRAVAERRERCGPVSRSRQSAEARGVCAMLCLSSLLVSASLLVGSKVPSETLDFGFPPSKINLAERVAGKNVVVLGLPGAFTPTW